MINLKISLRLDEMNRECCSEDNMTICHCPWLHRCDEGQDDHQGQDDPDSVCWCRECSCHVGDAEYPPGMYSG